MNKRIKEAVAIADAYRAEHNGEIPVLIVAHGKEGDFTVIGRFRNDERGSGAKTRADQKMFVSVLRIAFALKGVTSYEVITKPEVDNESLQLTQNLLSVFTVDENGTNGEFFEIEEDKLTPCFTNLEMGSWFASLLPSEFNVELDRKTAARIEKYIEACTFVPAVIDANAGVSGLDALAAM